MNYEEKYKEALERAKDMLAYKEVRQEDMEYLFPELEESEDEKTRKELMDFIYVTCFPVKDLKKKERFLAWLEKQGEQKPDDNVEPKFHEGEWILNNVCFPMQIASIKDGMYIFTEGDAISVSFINENYHLWTIHDANDGDVLVGKDDRPFIFTGEFDVQDDNPTAYCGINSDDKFITGKGSHWTFKDGIKPATKEQRKLLFSKMRESGYEWDSEKKELKKIEVASKESEDEKIRREIRNFIWEYTEKLPERDKWLAWFEKQGENKKLDADKVIEWLKNTIRETKEYFGEYGIYYNIRLTLPYDSIKDLINDFKEDFGL